MAKRIDIKGKSYSYAGRLYKDDWNHVEQLLRRKGCTYKQLVSKQLDFFIAGTHSPRKEMRARALGLPILREDQLERAMREGYFEYEEPGIDADTPIDELLGEVRGALAGEPSSEAWTRCLEAVERCQEDQLEVLLRYVQEGLTRWDGRELPQWKPKKTHALLEGAPRKWSSFNPVNELRVAPPVWLMEMTQGSYHPKHALTRALNLNGLRLNSPLAKKMFKNPYLTHVTHLDTGEQNKFTRGLIEGVREATFTPTLVWLTLRESSWTVKTWFEEVPFPANTLPALRELRAGNSYYDEHMIAEFERHPDLAGANLLPVGQ